MLAEIKYNMSYNSDPAVLYVINLTTVISLEV